MRTGHTLAAAAIAVVSLLLVGAQRPTVIGHRGTGSNANDNPFPENTIPSFEQAVAEGADMVELDVTLSADGAVVVIHDDTMDRTTDCTGCVDALDLAEIQLCDAAVGTSMEGTGVTVPTLAEVFEALGGAPINVEIKTGSCSGIPAADLVDAVYAVMLDAKVRPDVVLSSFSLAAMEYAEQVDPDLVTALLVGSGEMVENVQPAFEAGLDGIHPFFIGTEAEAVARAQNAGMFVNPWTVDFALIVRQLVDRGVNGIITDEPGMVVGVLDEYEWEDDDDDTDDDTGDDDSADDDVSDDDTGDDDDDEQPPPDDGQSDGDDDDDEGGCGG